MYQTTSNHRAIHFLDAAALPLLFIKERCYNSKKFCVVSDVGFKDQNLTTD
jgi:hypothetical protein